MKYMKTVVFLVAVLLPIGASAQYEISGVDGIMPFIAGIINMVFPILVSIAVFFIAWSIFVFILNAGDPEKRSQGGKRIFWGVIGVFLMLSVWGLVNILRSSIELNNEPFEMPSLLP